MMERRLIAFFICLFLFFGSCLQTLSDEELQQRFQAYMKRQEYNQALQIANEMVRRKPNEFDALSKRGIIFALIGRYKDAERDFESCIAINKEKGEQVRVFTADRIFWRSRGLSAQGDHEKAIDMLDWIIAMYPTARMAYLDRGGEKLAIGDYKGAIDDFSKAIELDTGNNDSGNSYELRARAKEAIGDKAGAVQDRQRAEKIAQMRAQSLSEDAPKAIPEN